MHPTDPTGGALALQELPAWLVRAELDRLLASPAFKGAAAHQRLLRHLVERCLAGEGARLKEAAVAVEVFQRPAARFDPAQDSIVRVEARRLRLRLARHYLGDGAGAVLRFELPPGQYLPQAQVQRPLPEATEAPDDSAADLADRGDYLIRLGTEDGYRRALERYEQAAARAPGLARAHFGVARAWATLVGMTLVPATPAIDHAMAAAQSVLALAPRHADALGLLAGLRHRYALDWPGAQALYQAAIAAAPGSAYLQHQWAFSLMFMRRFDEAAEALRLARRLDPLDPSVRVHEALLALYRGDHAQAEQALLAVLDLQPQVLAVSLLGYLRLLQGDAARALDCYIRVEREFPQLSIGPIGQAQALALAGRHADARALIAKLLARWSPRYLPPYQLALVALRLGEPAEALALLQQAVDERDANVVCLAVDPGWDPLRSDPRFDALLQRCGLARP